MSFRKPGFQLGAKEKFFLAIFLIGFFAPLCSMGSSVACAAANFREARSKMVQEIEADVKSTRFFLDREILDPRVMAAIATVPRHEFVPPRQKTLAYLNRPLPIGHGQTISQPYIVAVMTDLLNLSPTGKVLEVGTGSGYQAAVLAELAAEVFTIEIIRPLGEDAGERLARLGYKNVQVRIGDGYYGWKEEAPFDAIVVTAAASHIPPPLIQQLKSGGIMVIPVGTPFMTQQLLLVTKEDEEKTTVRQILPVRFVPLTGKH